MSTAAFNYQVCVSVTHVGQLAPAAAPHAPARALRAWLVVKRWRQWGAGRLWIFRTAQAANGPGGCPSSHAQH
jgi:hypothetical protein